MADSDQIDFDNTPLNTIYPHAASIFTRLKSLEEIKDDCYVVLDTNVLLALYTTGEEDLLDQCLKTYTHLKKRLIIPGQVAREFAKHRTTKLAELHMQIANKQIPSIQKGKYPLLSSLDQYKRIMDFEQEIDKKLREYKQEYEQAVKGVLAHIEGWRWNDPVSLLYNDVFTEETVLDPIVIEEEIQKDLRRRELYKNLPGYKDGWKGDKGTGDLLIWRTILEVGKAHKKSVIFVSGDGKPDWCQQSKGQPLYPKYELVYDFMCASEGQSFHIIKFSNFLKLYGASDKVVEEVRQEETRLTLQYGIDENTGFPLSTWTYDTIYQWLLASYPDFKVFRSVRGREVDFLIFARGQVKTAVKVMANNYADSVINHLIGLYSIPGSTFEAYYVTHLMVINITTDLSTAEYISKQIMLKMDLPANVSVAIGYLDRENQFIAVSEIIRRPGL